MDIIITGMKKPMARSLKGSIQESATVRLYEKALS